MTDQTLARLRELLLNEFSESELEQLCSDIGLRYADLRGTGAFGKTRELLEAARAQDKLRPLQNRIRELRPSAFAAAGLGAATASTAATIAPADRVKATVPSAATELPARTIGSAAPATTTTLPATETPTPTRERTAAPMTSARLLPIAAIALVVLLCVVAAASLILNRPTLAPNAAGATATAVAANANANATSAATAVAQSVPTQAPQVAATNAAAGDGAVVTPTTAAEGTVVAATAAATSTPELSPTVAQSAPSATPQATATPDPTTAAGQAHPAATVIRDLNQQLPEFYLGKVTATDLQKYWTGPAWTSVVSFGTTKLPRVMRVPAAQRGSLDVTYRYEQLPALQSERGDNAVVVAREYWRYANAANAIEICETRQYTYNLVKDGSTYKVREFNSRLLESGCN